MHHQNPVVPPESDVHPQNPVCTYSVIYAPRSFNEFMALLQANAVQGDCEKVYSNGDQCNGGTVESNIKSMFERNSAKTQNSLLT